MNPCEKESGFFHLRHFCAKLPFTARIFVGFRTYNSCFLDELTKVKIRLRFWQVYEDILKMLDNRR
jgi:hypothetical protein